MCNWRRRSTRLRPADASCIVVFLCNQIHVLSSRPSLSDIPGRLENMAQWTAWLQLGGPSYARAQSGANALTCDPDPKHVPASTRIRSPSTHPATSSRHPGPLSSQSASKDTSPFVARGQRHSAKMVRRAGQATRQHPQPGSPRTARYPSCASRLAGWPAGSHLAGNGHCNRGLADLARFCG